jgi:flagellar basal body P-ring formation protein FlgA
MAGLSLISICPAGADNQAITLQNQIQSQNRPVTAADIESVLIDHLLKSTPWKRSEIDIRSVEGLKGIEIPAGNVSLKVLSGTAVKGHGSILALIEALQDGKEVRCFWITAAIRINAEIVAAGRKIPQGARITSDELVQGLVEITDLHAGYFRKLEDVAGKGLRRTLSPGDPVIAENLSDPFLVRHGETVQLRLVRNGIVLTSSVKAEQDGRLGQFIKVRNVDFSSVLKARVTGPAEVSIE